VELSFFCTSSSEVRIAGEGWPTPARILILCAAIAVEDVLLVTGGHDFCQRGERGSHNVDRHGLASSGAAVGVNFVDHQGST